MVDLDNLDELIEEMNQGNAKYLLVNVIARRVRAYGPGDQPQIESESTDPAEQALLELRAGKLKLTKDSHEDEDLAAVMPSRRRDSEEEE